MQIEIARVKFSVLNETSMQLQDTDPAYGPFFREASNKSEVVDTTIRLLLGDMPGIHKQTEMFDSGQAWSMFRHHDEYRIKFQPPTFEAPLWLARIDRSFSEVIVYCGKKLVSNNNGKTVVSNPVCYPLDQILLMYVLAQREGALLHAAGIDIKGRGYIFPGKSGAGKTTIMRQLAAREHMGMLSDDRVVVRKIDGSFKAYGTPWPGEAGIAENRSVPLSGIFFIAHASTNGIREITQQEAVEKILPVTSIPWYDREVMPDVLLFCGDLITQVPTYELHFKPGNEVVDVLEDFIST
ncbi:MAG: hypothetical protein JRJ47_13575 [Deltaproteobacteria bacterium]|nr:hypothetical protein [Deltaproteobacteria bacterium]